MAKVNTKKRSPKTAEQQPVTRRGEIRREAILAAARDIFMDKGYAGTSVEEVTKRVGGSKASFYSYFGSKEGLFSEMIRIRCDSFLSTLEVPDKANPDVEGTLNQFGMRLLGLVTMPDRITTLRAIMSEATRFPELAALFYVTGPQRGLRLLIDLLQRYHDAGLIHCPHAELSAMQFSEMIKGAAQFRTLLGLTPFPEGIDARTTVESAVRIFLASHIKPCKPVSKKVRP